MASSRLATTALTFWSDTPGTDVNARITGANDLITFQGNGGADPVALANAASLALAGATSGDLTHTVPAVVTDYTVTWPAAGPTSTGQILVDTNGAGTLAWQDHSAPSAFSWKGSVVAATTVTGVLATAYANGQVIDGVTLATGDRILIKDQGTGTENGIYTVEAAGAPTRTADFATGFTVAGAAVISEEGTANADSAWVCTNDAGTDVVGTDALVFAQFGSVNTVTVAGAVGDVQFANAGATNLAAATLSAYTFTDNAVTPTLSVGVEDGGFFVTGAAATTATSLGSGVFLTGGLGNTSGNGGQADILGGAGGVTGAGGTVTLTGGAGGGTSGNGGGISLNSGTPTDGDGGLVALVGSAGVGTNRSGGDNTLTAGASTGTAVGGVVTLLGGAGGATGAGGAITLTSGAGGATSGAGGALTLNSGAAATSGVGGAVDINAAAGAGANVGGAVTIDAGASGAGATGAGGAVDINAGAAASTNGAGGAVLVDAGAGTGTGAGGATGLTSGAGGATGAGGLITLTGGAGGGTSGAAGGVTLVGGTPTDGNGGSLLLTGSDGVGTNRNGGDLTLTGGAETGVGTEGTVTVTTSGGGQAATSTTTGSLRVTGGAGFTGDVFANEFNATSDVRFKTNISRINNPLDKLMAIEGYTYNWKNDGVRNHKKKQIGVLAQQLEEVGLGEIVNGNETDGKAVNYLALIPLIIEALKELAETVTEVVEE